MHVKGICHVYLAVDVGFAIDVSRAEQILAGHQRAQNFKRPRLVPEPTALQRRSCRFAQSGPTVDVGAFRTEGAVDLTLWEFGAATVRYRIAIDHELTALTHLADLLWDNPQLLFDARTRARELLEPVGAAVDKPHLGGRVEDYVVFELQLPSDVPVESLWTEHAKTTASLLRAEPGPLSTEEISDALAVHCAYAPDEVLLIDWFAAVVVSTDADDERLVMELCVAELLELRLLDEQLDRAIDAAYNVLRRKPHWLDSLRFRDADLAMVSQLQADAAVLFEGADNALKLLGDQYLARLYRVVSTRFHLPAWDAAIERKLQVLDGIHAKLASRTTTRRFEMLEVVIVVLIAISTVLPFVEKLWD